VASQSPASAEETSALESYRMSWLTANSLLRDGYSWSGNERNISYLNLPSMPMANISAVSGLDFADDARGLAVSDWDRDGDLDVWLTNRTGPSVRFLLNESKTAENSIQFRLTTNSGNREAIGARVILQSEKFRQHKSVRAGNGYLSQSSPWLHFGLGTENAPVQVTVKWPDGKLESFTGLSRSGRFELRQGTGQSLKIPKKPMPTNLEAAPLPLTPVSTAARIVPYSRIPFPRMVLRDESGSQQIIGTPSPFPMFVLLWASWCTSCAAEMKALSAAQAEIEKLGLKVIAISTDSLDNQNPVPPQKTKRFLRRIRFPFASFPGEQSNIDQLEVVHRTLIDTHITLPLPSSFLLDHHGRIAAIYRGPVDVSTLLEDAEHLTKDGKNRLAVSTPFMGLHPTLPVPLDPIQVALTFYQGDYAAHARNYLRQLIQIAETKGVGHETMNRAELHFFLASLLQESGQTKDSISAYRFALAADPKKWEAHKNLAKILYRQQQWREALPHFKEAVQNDGSNIDLKMEYAATAFRLGLQAITREQVQQILILDPNHDMAKRVFQRLDEIRLQQSGRKN
jgi:peroxiredoxin